MVRAVVPKKVSQNLGKILPTCKLVDLNPILDPAANLCLKGKLNMPKMVPIVVTVQISVGNSREKCVIHWVSKVKCMSVSPERRTEVWTFTYPGSHRT